VRARRFERRGTVGRGISTPHGARSLHRCPAHRHPLERPTRRPSRRVPGAVLPLDDPGRGRASVNRTRCRDDADLRTLAPPDVHGTSVRRPTGRSRFSMYVGANCSARSIGHGSWEHCRSGVTHRTNTSRVAGAHSYVPRSFPAPHSGLPTVVLFIGIHEVWRPDPALAPAP